VTRDQRDGAVVVQLGESETAELLRDLHRERAEIDQSANDLVRNPLLEIDRATLRADFVASIDRFATYLAEAVGDRTFFERARDTVVRAAGTSLPERLPLATNHGDFVPRNILVGESDRVTVFDTRAQWRAPIYEDVARFLVALSASELQMLGQGWLYDRAELARYESEFLRGYFDPDAVPLRAVRLFECQRLLAIWVASAYQRAITGGLRKVRKSWVLGLRGRHLRRRIDSILGVLNDEG